MGEHFFESGFQFEQYINDRLLEVKDEGERRCLKELMRETLIPFYKHVEDSYWKLEDRLTKGQTLKNNRYEIITGVERRNKVDVTEEAMVPMDYADLHETIIDTRALRETIARGEAYKIMTVFLAMDYSELRRTEKEKRTYKAAVHTEYGEYSAEVIIEKNTSYQRQVQELYQVFEANGIEWNTVCMPYLSKFFDVYITSTQCPDTEEIEGIKIDFEEYDSRIIYDLIPMWNVRMLEENTSAYPDFALDRIHYEHCVFGSRIKDDRDYLVLAPDQKLWEVFRQDGDLHIVCNEEQPTRWKLIELGYDAWKQAYEIPVFGNFWDRKTYRCIHTMAELKRCVAELGYENQVELTDIVQKKDGIYDAPELTYSMDEFIEDEIRTGMNRSKLIFRFRVKNKDSYLNKDIISYLVSRMQWQLPEFECLGEVE